MAGIRTCDRESQVQRPNHYTTEPPIIRCVNGASLILFRNLLLTAELLNNSAARCPDDCDIRHLSYEVETSETTGCNRRNCWYINAQSTAAGNRETGFMMNSTLRVHLLLIFGPNTILGRSQ